MPDRRSGRARPALPRRPVQVWYNSCKHRSCPHCSALNQESWLHNARERLLSCPHYHVVFTMPHELHGLWRYNPRVFPSLLFRCVRDTLMELLQDPRYLGATPGMVLSLHTWGRTLALHPHLHVLITAGGWDGREWKPGRKDYLLPVAVLKSLYRGKLLGRLRDALAAGDLRLPPDQTYASMKRQLYRLGHKEWNVRIESRYDHGHGVLTYLARYLRGGPLNERRLLDVKAGQVRFRYRDAREGKEQVMALSVDDFLSRLLQHVPEEGLHTIRYYGVYASANRALLNTCRETMGQPPVAARVYVDWQSYWKKRGQPERGRCKVCQKALVATDFFAAGGIPPPSVSTYRKVA